MDVVKKYRGSFEKCLREYVRDRLEGRGDLVPERIFITHTPVDDGIVPPRPGRRLQNTRLSIR